MKPIHIFAPLAALAALSGCAVPAGPAYHQQRAQAVNPYEWHTVSVTPVASGSHRAEGGSSRVEYSVEDMPRAPARVEYTSEPVTNVYMQQPVYAPAPAYYYPPVTIGLDFVFGNWGHRSYRGRRPR